MTKTDVFLMKNMKKPLCIVDKSRKLLQVAELVYQPTAQKGKVVWICRVKTKHLVDGMPCKDIQLSDDQSKQIKDEGNYLSLVMSPAAL